tara:strand:- start:3804 stop:4334 length:531 start_codon:yes stop_codon:yes gene_type:complete
MLKEASSGFSKFFTKQRVVILVIFLLLAFVLTSYASGKSSLDMNMLPNEGYHNAVPPTAGQVPSVAPAATKSPEPQEPKNEESFTNMSVNSPSDLLPTNSGDSSLVNSMMTQDGQMPGNLLESGAHIGLPTTSSSMRNANLQLRADPVIPKKGGCWWGESTISPDPNPIGIKSCDN